MVKDSSVKDWFIFLMSSARNRGAKKKKKRFITYMINEFGQKKYPCVLDENKMMTNLLIGNLHKAKKLVVVGYDTPTKFLGKYDYYPINANKDEKKEKKQLILKQTIYILIFALCLVAVILLWKKKAIIRIAAVLSAGLILTITSNIPTSWWNKYNANKNSAAVAIALGLLEKLGPKQTDVAFAFVDSTAQTYQGYIRLRDILEKYKITPDIYILECLASGKDLYLVTSGTSNMLAKPLIKLNSDNYQYEEIMLEKEKVQNSLLSLYPRAMMIVAGNKEGEDIVVHDTRSNKDLDADIDRMNYICATMAKVLKPAKEKEEGETKPTKKTKKDAE